MQRLRLTRRRIVVLLAAVASVMVFASAAYASGSFTWTASFSVHLRSRDYSTPNSGTHTIRAYMNCHNDQLIRTYQITLWRNISFWPDHSYGGHTYNCGVTNSTSWGVGDTGTFHFDLDKGNDGIYWDGNGTTFYP